mgnify:CR=1 FL=1
MRKDTIAAIATAMTNSGIGIVRMSGTEAFDIIQNIYKGKNNKNLSKEKSHTIHYGYIMDGEETIDEVLVMILKGPHSFTGEDTVEINCHGGISSTNKILEILLNNGCRLAEPGEFTKRAFLNGRIDLTQAESIMDIINSENESSRRHAIKGINGYISNKIREIRQKMLELLASIEVNIDYPEYEDIVEMTNNLIIPEITNIKEEIKKLIEKSENGKIINSGIKTAIIGRPNVGKSSILNRLIDEDKAIVTNIAGTTRDTVEGKINIGGITLNIIDTAGIRETEDIVEKIGVEKSIKLIDEADLVLAVFNNNEKLTEEDRMILDKIEDKKAIIVINKSDLEQNIEIDEIKNKNIIKTNTLELDGIESLFNKIKELFNLNELKEQDYTYLSNARQISLAKEALITLEEVIDACNNDIPVDMVEIDIRKSWETLGKIIGESYSEELIDQLFSQFCLGK